MKINGNLMMYSYNLIHNGSSHCYLEEASRFWGKSSGRFLCLEVGFTELDWIGSTAECSSG